jgi:hypothetical protein
LCDNNYIWVSQEIHDTREDSLVVECQFIKKRELSKKPDQYQIPNLSMTKPESEESESEEVITNSEP